jgi:hypothetical protein
VGSALAASLGALIGRPPFPPRIPGTRQMY